jgi:hypothetical protein
MSFTSEEIQQGLMNMHPTGVQCVHGVSAEPFPINDGKTGVLVKLFGHSATGVTTCLHIVTLPEEALQMCSDITGILLDLNFGKGET